MSTATADVKRTFATISTNPLVGHYGGLKNEHASIPTYTPNMIAVSGMLWYAPGHACKSG
jgi:hypothetical protein